MRSPSSPPPLPPSGDHRTVPSILHVDLDAFFASVEQLDVPSLRGKPVLVGGRGRRGVVATSSYEARARGVKTGMPIGMALRVCPDATVVEPRFDRYEELSTLVMGVLFDESDLVEQVSVDEAFVDVAHLVTPGAHSAVQTPEQVCERIRAQVEARTGLTVSVGAGSTKLVAKMASSVNKPDGQCVVPVADSIQFLHGFPVGKVWGVGPSTEDRLRQQDVTSVAELAEVELPRLVRMFGAARGTALYRMARNDDPRAVLPPASAKSAGASRTFEHDLHSPALMARELRGLARDAMRRMRASGATGGNTVVLTVRRSDFSTFDRSVTVPGMVTDEDRLVDVARRILGTVDVSGGVRMLGVSLGDLEYGDAPLVQPELPLPLEQGWSAGTQVRHDHLGHGVVVSSSRGWTAVRFAQLGEPVLVRSDTLAAG